MIVHDSHCHFFSARFFEALGREKYGAASGATVEAVAKELDWDPPGEPAALATRWADELNRHRVSRAALIASVPGDEESVAIAVTAHPDRFVGFFIVNPVSSDGLERAERGLTTHRMRCVCLFPSMHRYRLDDDRVVRLFEIAAKHRAAVFAHCGYLSIEARTRLGLPTLLDLRYGDPLALAATAARFPQVPVIVPHFGGGFFREALMAAEACPSIHFDTSSSNGWIKFVPDLTLGDVFRRTIAVAGSHRILFGSDSSFFPRGWRKVIHGAQRAILEELGCEEDSCRKIFSANFERLFPA
jgi:predicted TIM-barrel fold metal-dependent hydrolase